MSEFFRTSQKNEMRTLRLRTRASGRSCSAWSPPSTAWALTQGCADSFFATLTFGNPFGRVGAAFSLRPMALRDSRLLCCNPGPLAALRSRSMERSPATAVFGVDVGTVGQPRLCRLFVAARRRQVQGCLALRVLADSKARISFEQRIDLCNITSRDRLEKGGVLCLRIRIYFWQFLDSG